MPLYCDVYCPILQAIAFRCRKSVTEEKYCCLSNVSPYNIPIYDKKKGKEFNFEIIIK